MEPVRIQKAKEGEDRIYKLTTNHKRNKCKSNKIIFKNIGKEYYQAKGIIKI